MKRITVIEDDPAILDTMSMIFSDRYEVLAFSDAERFFTGDFEQPDLFIIDKELSGRSGVELCKHLKSSGRTQTIPIIMISASPDIHRLARDAGADDSVEKPFEVKAIRQAVAKYLSPA